MLIRLAGFGGAPVPGGKGRENDTMVPVNELATYNVPVTFGPEDEPERGDAEFDTGSGLATREKSYCI